MLKVALIGLRSGWRTRNLKRDPRWLVRAPKLTWNPSSLQRNVYQCRWKKKKKKKTEWALREWTCRKLPIWVLEINRVATPVRLIIIPPPNSSSHRHRNLPEPTVLHPHQVLSVRRVGLSLVFCWVIARRKRPNQLWKQDTRVLALFFFFGWKQTNCALQNSQKENNCICKVYYAKPYIYYLNKIPTLTYQTKMEINFTRQTKHTNPLSIQRIFVIYLENASSHFARKCGRKMCFSYFIDNFLKCVKRFFLVQNGKPKTIFEFWLSSIFGKNSQILNNGQCISSSDV